MHRAGSRLGRVHADGGRPKLTGKSRGRTDTRIDESKWPSGARQIHGNRGCCSDWSVPYLRVGRDAQRLGDTEVEEAYDSGSSANARSTSSSTRRWHAGRET